MMLLSHLERSYDFIGLKMKSIKEARCKAMLRTPQVSLVRPYGLLNCFVGRRCKRDKFRIGDYCHFYLAIYR